MADTTEIEKKSLEAHVELCAERYHFLEERLLSLDEKIAEVATGVAELKSAVNKIVEKNNDRLINWGIGIIVTLLGTCAWLIQHYVFK